MKNIFVLFIALFSFASCQKKFNYECKVYTFETRFNPTVINEKYSQNQVDRFIYDNTKDIDGSEYTYTNGEKWVECSKK